MKTYDNHKYVQFSDVLDAVTLFYIIKQEVKEEMEAENVRFVSDDDSDSNESGDSDEYGEEQGESEQRTDCCHHLNNYFGLFVCLSFSA